MMSSSSSVATRLHPYPTILRSGVLALILGASTIFGTAVIVYPYSYTIFVVGIAAGAVAFTFFKNRYLYGRPTPLQTGAIFLALILGVGLLIGLFFLRTDYGSHTFLLWLFLIVGIAFIPLSVASGPWMILLACVCILNAGLGLWLGLPFTILAIVDGVAKIIVGVVMLRARPAFPAQSAQPVQPAQSAQADMA